MKKEKIELNIENMTDEDILNYIHFNRKDENLHKWPKLKKIKMDNITDHFEINILNQKYYFPYKPYETQIKYCKSVIDTLKNKSNCALQSPTGTGKTLSLLVSTIGYLYNQGLKETKEVFPKRIIYLSRTHSQLNQIANEIKKWCYKPIATILASRDKYCINKELSEFTGINKQLACNKQIKNKTCKYYRGNETKNFKKISNYLTLDIEDLANNGRINKFCPYYYNKSKYKKAHIILMPYNYLTDDIFRSLILELLKDSIIIIDEAHNFTTFLENGASFNLNSETLQNALNEIKQLNDNKFKEIDTEFISVIIKNWFNKLNNYNFKENHENTYNNIDQMVLNLNYFKYFFDIFDVKLEFKNFYYIFKNLVLNYRILEDISYANSLHFPSISYILLFIIRIKNIIYNLIKLKSEPDDLDFYFKYKICIKRKKYLKKNITELHIWCLSPSITMNKVLKLNFHSIIFTSGTLENINFLKNQLNINFNIIKEFPHVSNIDKQLSIRIITKLEIKNINNSIKEVNANYNFKNRDKDELKESTSLFLINIVKIIPQGLLVYFPSYQILNKYYKYLKERNYLKLIEKYKNIYTENNENNSNLMKKFKKNCNIKNSGAIFFLVFHGKFSEGIDFKDELCRGIIIFGIPFMNFTDLKIKSKLDNLNEFSKFKNIKENGDFWYKEHAILSVNQTIGRILRHPNDFGIILLIDERYDDSTYVEKFSNWFKNYVKKSKNQEELFLEIKNFYEDKFENFNLILENKNKDIKFKNEFIWNKKIKKINPNKNLSIIDFFNKKTENKHVNIQSNTNNIIENKNIEIPKKKIVYKSFYCIFCKKFTKDSYKSPCNHIGCDKCWPKNKYNCTICKIKVKIEDLLLLKVI